MASSTETRWRPGMVIGGKYALTRLLGRGGLARVYEAQNTWIGRRVAIKVLHPQFARNDEAVTRFQQEAKATSLIDHPNIVDVLDLGQDPTDGSFYIVQE